MRIKRTVYYFLFLAITAGAFASMAQNNYGLKIISWSCYFFALTFLVELILGFTKMTMIEIVEQISITIFITLFGFRAAYIHFQYVEWIVVGTAVILAIIYTRILIEKYLSLRSENLFLSRIIAFYYISVIAFLLSVSLRPVTPLGSQAVAGLGGLGIGIVVFAILFQNRQLLQGEETKILKYAREQNDHSSWFVTGFLMISLYVGLNFIGVLPTLYTDEVPQAYIELVNEAETGRAKAINGRYQHDLYKEELDKFLERHNTED